MTRLPSRSPTTASSGFQAPGETVDGTLPQREGTTVRSPAWSSTSSLCSTVGTSLGLGRVVDDGERTVVTRVPGQQARLRHRDQEHAGSFALDLRMDPGCGGRLRDGYGRDGQHVPRSPPPWNRCSSSGVIGGSRYTGRWSPSVVRRSGSFAIGSRFPLRHVARRGLHRHRAASRRDPHDRTVSGDPPWR